MKRYLYLVAFGAWVCSHVHGHASTPKDTAKVEKKANFGPLFKNDDVIKLRIVTNIKALQKDRGASPSNHWAELYYARKKKGDLKIPIKLKVRGNFRKAAKNCIFPPLLLDLPQKKDKNSIFERQNRLKLVTHCQSEEYIFNEYLVYRMYNLITNYSFRARIAQVTYEDSAGLQKPVISYAFLLEDEDDMAKRNKAKDYTIKQIPMPRIDSLQMATVAVFEYMIGNTDWSVPYLHNIKLLAPKGGKYPIPVPYDFDHSGIVEAKYAQPAEQLELASVRERLYRGLTYPPALLQQVFARFKAAKPEIYALYQNNPHLKPGYVKRTLRYLDDFYSIIDNPKDVKRLLIYGGGKPQAAGVVIKGLN
ncbi:MAG TPA: hypothetical protein DCM71_04985 [Runella sp.]|nr:hypothetical protein [Runella sp.]